MQNRYAGDVGDFSKFGLLKAIAGTGLAVGINWYLVADEAHNDDGKHVGFLSDRRFEGCDDELRGDLGCIVSTERSVAMLEQQALISGAEYYGDELHPPATAKFSRAEWHKKALERLGKSTIVFLDPDNGILVGSVSPKSRKSIKYALRDEIKDYYTAGHSVIVYNHRCRQNEAAYLRRFDWLHDEAVFPSASVFGLKFMRGTTRDYIFAVQPDHITKVLSAVNDLMNSPWNRHFVRLSL